MNNNKKELYRSLVLFVSVIMTFLAGMIIHSQLITLSSSILSEIKLYTLSLHAPFFERVKFGVLFSVSVLLMEVNIMYFKIFSRLLNEIALSLSVYLAGFFCGSLFVYFKFKHILFLQKSSGFEVMMDLSMIDFNLINVVPLIFGILFFIIRIISFRKKAG